MKKLYACAAVLGTLVPYYFLVQFVVQHGLNFGLFFEQWFATTIAQMGAADLFISCFVFWVFAHVEARQLNIRQWWLCIPATLLVGLSLSLPLFLFWREQALENRQAA